jgi:hypothetical protein
MNNKKRTILLLATAAFMMTAGCFSLNPDNFIPESLAPAGNDLRIDGTVNVQASVPRVSKSRVLLFESSALKGALEKAIAQKGIFQRIERGKADYYLDVWITDAIREIKTIDGYMIDVTAVWRLTRARDGEIIFCDFAKGHGASYAVGSNAYVNSLETATREMIQKGLSALSDRKTPLAAMYLAVNWPSISPFVAKAPKEQKPVRKVVEPARKLAAADLSLLVRKISARIAPFTLDEVRSGLPAEKQADPPGMISHSGRVRMIPRTRLEGTTSFTVQATINEDAQNRLQSVEVRIKKGAITIQDTLAGNRGSLAAIFTLPLADRSDQIGFGSVVIEEQGVFTEYLKKADGTWTTESYKIVVE